MTEVEYLESIIKPLIKNPKKLIINKKDDEKGTLLVINADENDYGKILGINGDNAKSIRHIMRAFGAEKQKIAVLINAPFIKKDK